MAKCQLPDIHTLSQQAEQVVLRELEQRHGSHPLTPEILDAHEDRVLDRIEGSKHEFTHKGRMGQLHAIQKYRELHDMH